MEKANLDTLEKVDLSSDEMKAIKNVWGKLNLKIDPLFYRMFKTLEGFNANYLSDDLFFPLIIRTLNPSNYVATLEHKGLYPILYKDLNQPEVVVIKINGVYYDKTMNILDESEALKRIGCVQDCIIKPSVGSCMGRNVKKFSPCEMSPSQLKQFVLSYRDNFIIQLVVKQSEKTKIFNESSLNTFRVSTLNLNGRISNCIVNFRCGRNGACVDNGGAGGLFMGVSPEGQFHEYAYDNKYHKYYETDSGVKFASVRIDEVKDLVAFAIEAHRKYIPVCAFAGWDLALDEKNKPVFIEVNLGFPGIQLEQLTAAQPIFGSRTQEVVDYVVKNKKMI